MLAMFVTSRERECALQMNEQLLILHQSIVCSSHIYKVVLCRSLKRYHNHPKFKKRWYFNGPSINMEINIHLCGKNYFENNIFNILKPPDRCSLPFEHSFAFQTFSSLIENLMPGFLSLPQIEMSVLPLASSSQKFNIQKLENPQNT